MEIDGNPNQNAESKGTANLSDGKETPDTNVKTTQEIEIGKREQSAISVNHSAAGSQSESLPGAERSSVAVKNEDDVLSRPEGSNSVDPKQPPVSNAAASGSSSAPNVPSAPSLTDAADVPQAVPSAPSDPELNPGDNAKATSSVGASTKADLVEKPKQLSLEERSGKFAAMARKRGREEEEEGKKEKKEKKEDAKAVIYVTDSKGRRVKVIDDDLEEMDCEFLNNRQAFLNLCQGNHYQYDQLRRAKHSSMMVLWHLHNRDAPKFVQQCTTCSREILQGYRYHCPTCADFDQCEECVRNPDTPRHPHPLKPIPVASNQQTELTEAQRNERQRSIQLHMTLLLHAATCQNAKCPSANCQKMKGLLKHGAQCKQKATGGCNVCKRIWALLQIHARQCKQSSCPVPNCMAIRERVRQLKKQQQAMDDRRRQQMNSAYRMGSR